ncbi:MAG: hypothetical protein AAF570_21380, partial [Bacteroidota bacterium]
MPNVNIVYWNVERFGKDRIQNLDMNYDHRCELMAHAALNMQADVICIIEFMDPAPGGFGDYLETLQTQLNLVFNNSDGPRGNWHYDSIGGALNINQAAGGGTLAESQKFESNNKLEFQGNRGDAEGYAVFWNQNVAKFTM